VVETILADTHVHLLANPSVRRLLFRGAVGLILLAAQYSAGGVAENREDDEEYGSVVVFPPLSDALVCRSPIDAALGAFNQFFRGMAFDFTRRPDPRARDQALPWRGLIRYRVRVASPTPVSLSLSVVC
jgi:hypothetical protein